MEASQEEKTINMLWVINLVAQVTLWPGMFNCLLRSAKIIEISIALEASKHEKMINMLWVINLAAQVTLG